MAARINIRGLNFKNEQEAMEEFARIGSTLPGSKIMASKALPLALKISGIGYVAANILKQEALARGGDVATARDSLLAKEGTTQVIIIGTENMMKSLAQKIRLQPFGLKELARELDRYLKGLNKETYFTVNHKRYNLDTDYLVMGILNVTPDSFYDGGYYYHPEDAEKRVNQIIDEGADIIDIGGMSTRPGSDPVRVDQEIERTVPLIKNIRATSGILISIDTYRKEVAEQAAAAGADIVNDISALSSDRQMAGFLADSGLSVVMMHMKGTPKDMQKNPVYEDVVSEVYAYLDAAAGRAVAAGIDPDKIVVDPGIGFGKTAGHNLAILKKLAEFRYLGYPVLLGASRKSFMGKTLDLEVDQRMLPSLAVAAHAYLSGARIFRVHDVEQTRRVLDMVKNIEAVS